MRNLKVMMAYRGTAYHGFQRQDNALTVQEVVERYVSKVLNHKCIINGCSRTDAGVHANNYCFSVLTESISSGVVYWDRSSMDEAPKVSEKSFSYSGKTWSSSARTLRLRSEAMSMT